MASSEEMTEEAVERIAEAVPEFVESMKAIKIKFALLGAAIGTAAGAMSAWAIAYRKAEAKYSTAADDEIAEMREHYQAKGRALEAQAGKVDLAQMVEERGYISPETEPPGRPQRPRSSAPPMAVQPPSTVIVDEDEAAGEAPDDSEMAVNAVEGPNGVRPTHPANAKEPETRNIFRDREQAVEYEWNDYEERRKRSVDRPYVIHYDERHEMEGYSEESLTYYAADDVLCNERDEVMDPAEREQLVGEANLDRFGHGSGSPEIVFVRNDNLEIMYEIVKSPNSFAEEVHGITHGAWDRGNLERMHRRERGDAEA
jgi:hypothetical protein